MIPFLRRASVPEKLRRVRELIARDRLRRAASEAERLVAEATAAGEREAAVDAAEAWMLALDGVAAGPELAAAAERCRALGVTTPTVLRTLAAEYAVVGGRRDLAALEVYVEAIERRALKDPALKKSVLRALAAGLHVDVERPPPRVDARIPLLKRLERAVPKLGFPRLFLGRHAYLRRDFALAAEHLQQVSGAAAQSPKVLNLLGRSLEKVGAFDAATAAYAGSLHADRRQPAIHFRLGRLVLARWVDALEAQ
ncbi:MAG TPA: hypothetical protein VEI02_03100 [Planctomycetota bacterium]|nr:hypothetical protein [Planctomycetota bacterium]